MTYMDLYQMLISCLCNRHGFYLALGKLCLTPSEALLEIPDGLPSIASCSPGPCRPLFLPTALCSKKQSSCFCCPSLPFLSDSPSSDPRFLCFLFLAGSLDLMMWSRHRVLPLLPAGGRWQVRDWKVAMPGRLSDFFTQSKRNRVLRRQSRTITLEGFFFLLFCGFLLHSFNGLISVFCITVSQSRDADSPCWLREDAVSGCMSWHNHMYPYAHTNL